MMAYLLAGSPVLVLLGLMILLRWGGLRAAPAAWLACLAVSAVFFGLTPQIFWSAQGKALFLGLTVLAVLWPALLLYHLVDQAGGIHALAEAMESRISDRGVLLITTAWAFSGALEGLAGFGLPIVVVAPMLAALGVNPWLAVAAVAVGHSWSITFGDMGLIYQTLVNLTGLDPQALAVPAALLLGLSILACGLAVGILLGQAKKWPFVLITGCAMAAVQFWVATRGAPGLASLSAGITGVLCGFAYCRLRMRDSHAPMTSKPSAVLSSTLACYGFLAVTVASVGLIPRLHALLVPFVLRMDFPETVTRAGYTAGYVTAAGPGPAFRVLLHPGLWILLTALLGFWLFRGRGLLPFTALSTAAQKTWRSAGASSLVILVTISISALMEQCGMTLLLAQGASQAMGSAFPLVSPLLGIFGAFATGSNNNSNVLFAVLNRNVAGYLGLDANVLVAAQTTGGALGSMVAPAKIIVGCSAVNLVGKDGEIVRRMFAYVIPIGLLVGLCAWLLAR